MSEQTATLEQASPILPIEGDLPLLFRKKGIRVEKTLPDRQDLNIKTDIYGGTEILRYQWEVDAGDAWYIKTISPFDRKCYGMRLQPRVYYQRGVREKEILVSFERLGEKAEKREVVFKNVPIHSLIPTELHALVDSGCLGVAMALSTQEESERVLQNYEKSVAIDKAKHGTTKAKEKHAQEKAYAAELLAYEQEVAGLFKIERKINKRKQYVESLSLAQQAHLIKAKKKEHSLRKKKEIEWTAKCEWFYMKDKPWFWKPENFYPPIGVVSRDSIVNSGENQALGYAIDLDSEGEWYVFVFEENINRVIEKIKQTIPYSEENLQQINNELFSNETLLQKTPGKAVKIIRRLANTRLLQEKLWGVDQVTKVVIGHELRHIHDILSGNRPQEGAKDIYFFAYEAVAYLTEYVDADIPFNLLTRLATLIEHHGDKIGMPVKDFVAKINLRDTGSRSLIGGILALDFMLRELSNISLFKNRSTDEQALSLKDISEKLTVIAKVKKAELNPVKKKLIKIIDDYDLMEDKADWLRKILGHNI